MPQTRWRTALFWFFFIFTCLATTDIFPMFVRKQFIYPYKIKAVPCIIAWCVVFADLMLLRPSAKVADDAVPAQIAPEL